MSDYEPPSHMSEPASIRCRHCGTPIICDADSNVWSHTTGHQYFCWVHGDYVDPDYAEPHAPERASPETDEAPAEPTTLTQRPHGRCSPTRLAARSSAGRPGSRPAVSWRWTHDETFATLPHYDEAPDGPPNRTTGTL